MIRIPLVRDYPLLVAFEPSFVRQRRLNVAGLLQLKLVIKNCGELPAHRPFICIPSVGIAVRPSEGWCFAKRARNSGAIGLSSAPEGVLAPGGSVSVCTLTMPVMKSEGGSIWACGYGQPLGKLADIRLISTLGAENLAPARLSLRIKADDIRSAIAAQFSANDAVFGDAGRPAAQWRQASA
jgi:hypothetical protein